MGRDYIKEIKAKYENLYEGKDRWDQLSLRIDPLLESLDEIKKVKSDEVKYELLRGSIIGIVSCIEGYLRLAIRDIINHGEPFASNAELIQKNRKIKNLTIPDDSVTKGDLISHTLSLNKISDIEEILSNLLGIDFWPSIQLNPVSDDDMTPLNEFNPELFDLMEELFSYRHMFAHELATDVYIEFDDVEYLVSSGFLFIHATEEMIDTCLHGEEIL